MLLCHLKGQGVEKKFVYCESGKEEVLFSSGADVAINEGAEGEWNREENCEKGELADETRVETFMSLAVTF